MDIKKILQEVTPPSDAERVAQRREKLETMPGSKLSMERCLVGTRLHDLIESGGLVVGRTEPPGSRGIWQATLRVGESQTPVTLRSSKWTGKLGEGDMVACDIFIDEAAVALEADPTSDPISEPERNIGTTSIRTNEGVTLRQLQTIVEDTLLMDALTEQFAFAS